MLVSGGLCRTPPGINMPIGPCHTKTFWDLSPADSGSFRRRRWGSVQSSTHWPEWEMLHKETAKTLAVFILRNIIYRWGTLLEIVSDNSAPFVKALTYLAKHYHITHIRISGYNSRANGLVERSHFDV